jgi:energy-coupling factor transporter ATP-binding protein EcfA2
VNEAASQIRDKDIILMLGNTGSGKSTTIHFLAGSKMEEMEINGIFHIGPSQITNP